MAYQTWIADKIREYGVKVVEVSGWQTRGSSTFNPKGVVAHHTASRQGSDAPALGIVTRGRSDLPGPLSQILLSRSGIAYVVAAGRANHAGTGGFRGLSGNTSVFGIEAENDGVGETWSDQQLDAYYKVCAALLEGIDRDSSWVCGHKEWAPRRKIDPNAIDMNIFRSNVSRVKKGEPTQGVLQYDPKPSFKPESGDLTIWMHGERTGIWQAHLIKYAAQKISADGYFGPSTHNSTVNFQRFFGLTPDGIVGEKTLSTMAFAKAEQEKPAQVKQPTIKRGSTGQQVKEIQGIIGVEQDGVFGPVTEKALKRLQEKLGVAQTGAWDKATREAHAALPVYTGQPIIRLGSKGEAVKLWQTALNKHAGKSLKVDGAFGPNTVSGTRDFQNFFGMRANGVVGPDAWNLMDYISRRA